LLILILIFFTKVLTRRGFAKRAWHTGNETSQQKMISYKWGDASYNRLGSALSMTESRSLIKLLQ